jgi:hypothetical protein
LALISVSGSPKSVSKPFSELMLRRSSFGFVLRFFRFPSADYLTAGTLTYTSSGMTKTILATVNGRTIAPTPPTAAYGSSAKSRSLRIQRHWVQFLIHFPVIMA